MNTIKLLAYDIEWDCECFPYESPILPERVIVTIDLSVEEEGRISRAIDRQVSDQLSDLTGWCVLGYSLKGYVPNDSALDETTTSTKIA